MYLLEERPAPDYVTIARFISLHLARCSKHTLAETTNTLIELGDISGNQIFIDGTKIESAANKYTIVWKKAVTKNQKKVTFKISELVSECKQLDRLKNVWIIEEKRE